MSGPLQSAVKAGRSLTKAEKLAEQGFHLKMVNSFLRKNPSLSRFRDDLESAANFGLAEADKSFQSGNFEALATTVIRRRMIKEIRGLLGESEQSPRRAVSLNARTPAGGEIVDLMPTRSPSPLRTLLAKEDLSRLEQAMGKLPARERGLVEMDLLGNSVAEMADSLGIKARSVSTMLSTAKAKLRKELSATVLAPLFMEEEAQAQPSRFRPGPLEGQQGGQQPSRFQPGPLADEPEGFLGTSMQSLSKVPGDLLKVLTGDSDAPPVPGDTLMRLGGTMPRVEGALAALGHASDPIFNALGNVGRTFMASAPPSYGPGVAGDLAPQDTPEEQEAKRLLFQQNISRIGNVSEESDRPTTGSASGDLIADVAASLIPIGKAVNLGRRVAGLGKARMVEEAVKETPDLARQVSRAVDEAEDIEKARRGAAAAQDAAMKADPAAVEAARQGQLKARVEGLGLVGEDELALLSMAKPADAKAISKQLLAEDAVNAGVPQSLLDLAQKRLLGGPARSEQDVKRMRLWLHEMRDNPRRAEELIDRLDPKPMFRGGELQRMRPLGSRGLSAAFTSAGVRLTKQGPTGERVFMAYEQGLHNSRIRAGQAVDRLQQLTGRKIPGFGGPGRGVKKMSGEEVQSLRKALDKGEAPLNERVREAADEIAAVNRQIALEAQILGVEVQRLDGSRHLFAPLENFYPHFVNRELLKSPAGMNKAVKAMMKQGMDPLDAERKLMMLIHGQRSGRFGNLEAAREAKLPESFYEVDPLKALPVYWERAFERLEAIRSFGPDARKAADDFSAAVGSEGGDAEFARWFLGKALNVDRSEQVAELWSRGVRSWNVFSKFTPLTGMINLTQSTQTAVRTGMRDTAKALFFSIAKRKEARRQALQGGAVKPRFNLFENQARDEDTLAVFDQVTESVATMLPGRYDALKSPAQEVGERVVRGLEAMGEFNLKYLSGLEPTERFNRTVAFQAGRRYAERQAQKLLRPDGLRPRALRRAEEELEELGLDPDAIRQAKRLTEDDLSKAGLAVVDATQFGAGFHQQPRLAASPLGKVWFQFRTFTFNNGRLIKDEFRRRPAHTLAVLGALGIPASVGFQTIRRGVTGRPDAEVVDDFADVAAASLWLDLWKAKQFGVRGVASFAGGPTLGEAVASGGDVDRFLRRQFPLRGIIPEKPGTGLLPISRQELGIGSGKRPKAQKSLGN